MSKRSQGGSRTVFVGNIPYDATEEQLMAVFQQAGPVASLRLKFDRDTGKPKGFGFCEFYDEETAESAIRNLDGREVNGRRLRVDAADSDNSSAPKRRDDGGSKHGGSQYRAAGEHQSSARTIENVMQGLQPQQVYNLVVAMKEQLETNPQQARNLLIANPQVTYALVQATVLLGMAPQLVEAPNAPGLASNVPAALAAIPQEQRELLQQVLALTPQQIEELPAAEQAQANLLRQQAMSVLGGHSF